MKVLVIATDGFGGHGGIALYVRNVLRGLCAHESRPHVVALPRVMPLPSEPTPDNLDWDVSGLGGEACYARAVLRSALRERTFDLVLCTHVISFPSRILSRSFSTRRLGCSCTQGIEVKSPAGKPSRHIWSPVSTP